MSGVARTSKNNSADNLRGAVCREEIYPQMTQMDADSRAASTCDRR